MFFGQRRFGAFGSGQRQKRLAHGSRTGRYLFRDALTSFPTHLVAEILRRTFKIALTKLICEGA
jgi:hypothetical protein